MLERQAKHLFNRLSYKCDGCKLLCQLASNLKLAASGFCDDKNSAFIVQSSQISNVCFVTLAAFESTKVEEHKATQCNLYHFNTGNGLVNLTDT